MFSKVRALQTDREKRCDIQHYHVTFAGKSDVVIKQVAQLSQIDRAAGWVSFGQSRRRHYADIGLLWRNQPL